MSHELAPKRLARRLSERIPEFSSEDIKDMISSWTDDGVAQWLADLPQTEPFEPELSELSEEENQALFRMLRGIMFHVVSHLPSLDTVRKFRHIATQCVLDPTNQGNIEFNSYQISEELGTTRYCSLVDQMSNNSCAFSQMDSIEGFPEVLYLTTTQGAQVMELSVFPYDNDCNPTTFDNARTLSLTLLQSEHDQNLRFDMSRDTGADDFKTTNYLEVN